MVDSFFQALEAHVFGMLLFIGVTCFLIATLATSIKGSSQGGIVVLILSFIMATASVLGAVKFKAWGFEVEIDKLKNEIAATRAETGAIAEQTGQIVEVAKQREQAVTALAEVVKKLSTAPRAELADIETKLKEHKTLALPGFQRVQKEIAKQPSDR